jgi:hypothetical protein
LLHGPNLGETELTLTIHVDYARLHRAELRITLDDNDGVELAQLAAASAHEGTTVCLTGIHRCFDIRIS